MNLAPKNKTSLVLFSVLFIHITILDLCFVDQRGLVFLWQESLHWLTLVVHFSIALTAVGFYRVMLCFTHKRPAEQVNTAAE